MKEPINDLLLDGDAEAQLIRELENQSTEQIKAMRAHERIQRRVSIELTPGNASQRDQLKLRGRTDDISEGGCGAIFPAPVIAGDIYRLRFDTAELDLPIVFAQALRCRMLTDESFEVGFRFFTKVRLESASSSDDLLG